MRRRTSSSDVRLKLGQLEGLSFSSCLDPGSAEDYQSNGAGFLFSVETRLWFLTRSKLIERFACRGLKPLSNPDNTDLGSHEMLEESLDEARDIMLDANEAPTLGAYGDAMELDEANHLDLLQQHPPHETAEEGQEILDDDTAGILSNDTATSVHDDSRAKLCGALYSNLGMMYDAQAHGLA